MNQHMKTENDIKEIKTSIIKIIKITKELYWNRIFNRKRYKQYIKFNSIIKHGKCHFRAPSADLNFTYHYFCMDLIDQGWKKENVTIQNNNTDGFNEFSSELIRTEFV